MEYSRCNESVKCPVCTLSNVKRNYNRHLIDKNPKTTYSTGVKYWQITEHFES